MFSFEKKKTPDVPYDLEKEWKNPSKASAWRKKIDERVEELKSMIRKGNSPEEFRELEVLLQGFLALKKIMNRVK